jgi:hypothetical protein
MLGDSKYDFHFQVWHPDQHCLQLRAESKRDLDKWRACLETIIDSTDADEGTTSLSLAVGPGSSKFTSV